MLRSEMRAMSRANSTDSPVEAGSLVAGCCASGRESSFRSRQKGRIQSQSLSACPPGFGKTVRENTNVK